MDLSYTIITEHLPQHVGTSVKVKHQVQESTPIDHFYALATHKHQPGAVDAQP